MVETLTIGSAPMSRATAGPSKGTDRGFDRRLTAITLGYLADDPLLKIAEVARLANVSPQTVRRDHVKGALAVVIVQHGHTRRLRVRLSEARRYAGI